MARSLAVSDELLMYCTKNAVDIALVQEPYVSRGKLHLLESGRIRVVKSKKTDKGIVWAAIVVFNNTLDCIDKPQLASEYLAAAAVNYPGQSPLDVISVNFQFKLPTVVFNDYLEKIHPSLLGRHLIGADANAFSRQWHHPLTNEKGRTLEGAIARLRLNIAKTADNAWTYDGPRGRSNIDVTLMADSLLGCLRSWCVVKGQTSSDHAILSFEIIEDFVSCDTGSFVRFRDRD